MASPAMLDTIACLIEAASREADAA